MTAPRPAPVLGIQDVPAEEVAVGDLDLGTDRDTAAVPA
jgi:hypothetical protein